LLNYTSIRDDQLNHYRPSKPFLNGYQRV